MSEKNENIKRCYVCNRILVNKVTDPEKECKTHGEHIIQNAIAGHYVSNKILCERCGNGYSKDDSNFSNIFASFLVLLNKGNNLHVLDRGKLDDKSIYGAVGTSADPDSPSDNPIVFKSGNISPKNPYYCIDEENRIITLYAEKNVSKNYWEKIRKDIAEKGLKLEDFKREDVNNLDYDGFLKLYFSKNNLEFNDSFKRGFVKIAVEFALDRGISRNDIDILKIDKNTLYAEIDYDKALMFPYVPSGEIDKIYESERITIEENFPSHSLRLFSVNYTDNTQKLFCYIDLFSTFQFYVLLNDKYKGKKVNEWYAHRLLKNRCGYTEEDIDSLMRSKDYYIAIKDIVSDQDERDCIMKLSYDNIKWELKEKLRKMPLEYDLKKSVETEYLRVIDRIGEHLINSFSSVELYPECLNEYSKKVINTALPNKLMLPTLLEDLNNQSFDGYKQYSYTITNSSNGYSSPDASLKLYQEDPESVRDYSYMKFITFSNYCYKEAGLME